MKNDTDDHPEGQPYIAPKKLFAFQLAEANHNSCIFVQSYCAMDIIAPNLLQL